MRDLFFIDITIRKIFSVKNGADIIKPAGKCGRSIRLHLPYIKHLLQKECVPTARRVILPPCLTTKNNRRGKTSYLAGKTIHLPRYTTAVSRGRMTREKAKRKARHKTPQTTDKNTFLKMSYLTKKRPFCAAPVPKPLLRAIKNVSASHVTSEMAPSAMRFKGRQGSKWSQK